MVTYNWRLAEVTEAAERPRPSPNAEGLPHKAKSFTKESQRRALSGKPLCCSSVKLGVLCGKRFGLPEPSTQLLSHQFVHQLRIGLAF